MSVVSAYDTSNNIANGSFNEFNSEINNTCEINLTKNYSYQNNENSIKLSKSISINGYNHSFDGENSEYIFDIDSNLNITFCDVKFLNYKNLFKNTTTSNITFINCNLTNRTNYNHVCQISLRSLEDSIPGYCSKPSSDIIKKAKDIVGKSSGIEAAKKLANWVKKNIHHETKAGFYQSPSTTLKRGKGNCACQTLLFLQMCQALGLDKNHEICFVHIGTMKFGNRHFFCTIDNICVDVDGSSKDPWGHGGSLTRPIFNITKYPLLPLAKNY